MTNEEIIEWLGEFYGAGIARSTIEERIKDIKLKRLILFFIEEHDNTNKGRQTKGDLGGGSK